MDAKAAFVLVLHAFVIWLGCGLTIAIGRNIVGLDLTLLLHAIAAPALAAAVSLVYFRKFGATGPLATAAIFVLFIVVMDGALVAPVFERSYAMFASILGTWLPFALIFAATYLMGIWVQPRDVARR